MPLSKKQKNTLGRIANGTAGQIPAAKISRLFKAAGAEISAEPIEGDTAYCYRFGDTEAFIHDPRRRRSNLSRARTATDDVRIMAYRLLESQKDEPTAGSPIEPK